MVEYRPIPDEVRALVRERVQAIEHIEVLLLLRAEAPLTLDARTLAARLRLPEPLVHGALVHLTAHGLVSEGEGSFQYLPTDPALARGVDTLAVCYADARVEMLRLVSANAVERLRSGSLRIFAEAFRLRGKKKDG